MSILSEFSSLLLRKMVSRFLVVDRGDVKRFLERRNGDWVVKVLVLIEPGHCFIVMAAILHSLVDRRQVLQSSLA